MAHPRYWLLLGIGVLALGLAFDRLLLPLFNIEFPGSAMAAISPSVDLTTFDHIVVRVMDMTPIAKGVSAIGSFIVVLGLAGTLRRWRRRDEAPTAEPPPAISRVRQYSQPRGLPQRRR
jgi:hypothetical protein